MRTNRRRPGNRRRPVSPLVGVILGAATLLVAAAVIVLAQRSPSGVPGINYHTVYADLEDVGNLRIHNDVRIAGVRVGQVHGTTSRGPHTRLRLQLSPDIGSVPEDSTVRVRTVGLLGARYAEIVPGRSERDVPDGGTLRSTDLSLTLGVPEALQTFDRETRGAVGRSLRALGGGVLGRGGDINEALRVAPTGADDFQATARAFLADETAAHALVPSLADAAGAFDRARHTIADLLDPADRSLRPFVDRRGATQASLDSLPPTLAVARPGLDSGRPLLAQLRRLSVATSTTLDGAPTALRSATRLLRDGSQPLQRALPLLRRIPGTARRTLRLTGALRPVLRPLQEAFDEAGLPVTTLGRHGCDVVLFGRNWRSFLAFGVPGGKEIGPLGEIRVEPLVVQPFRETGDDLVRLPTNADPYPEPCSYPSREYSQLDPTR